VCAEQLRLGGQLKGKGDLKRGYVVRGDDSTARAPCPNENLLPDRRSRLQLPELSTDEKQSQREEAFARATVASTRAQRFCFIMCPLDMKGIIGATMVVGCLQHGAGVCDEQFTGRPLLAELKARMYYEPGAVAARLRRLHHLILQMAMKSSK